MRQYYAYLMCIWEETLSHTRFSTFRFTPEILCRISLYPVTCFDTGFTIPKVRVFTEGAEISRIRTLCEFMTYISSYIGSSAGIWYIWSTGEIESMTLLYPTLCRFTAGLTRIWNRSCTSWSIAGCFTWKIRTHIVFIFFTCLDTGFTSGEFWTLYEGTLRWCTTGEKSSASISEAILHRACFWNILTTAHVESMTFLYATG